MRLLIRLGYKLTANCATVIGNGRCSFFRHFVSFFRSLNRNYPNLISVNFHLLVPKQYGSRLWSRSTVYLALCSRQRPTVLADELKLPFAEPCVCANTDGLWKLTCKHDKSFHRQITSTMELDACKTAESRLDFRCSRRASNSRENQRLFGLLFPSAF